MRPCDRLRTQRSERSGASLAHCGRRLVDLAGDVRPDKLYLDLIFSTEDDRDQSFVLEHVREGRYITQGPDNLRYRWYLQIQPVQGDDAEWRLIGEARFPNETSVALLPGGRSESE